MGVGEECGVVACVLKNKSVKVSTIIYGLLCELQHRGQTSSGMTVYSSKNQRPLKSLKSAGKVANLFKTWDKAYFDNVIDGFCGEAGIGHVRYATSNVNDDISLTTDEAQPFVRNHGQPRKRFAITFNGHLTNYDALRESLIRSGYSLDTKVDTEVLIHLISFSLNNYWTNSNDGFFSAFEKVVDQLDGSFCFCFMDALGNLVVARDRLGFKPLVIGENENMICVASESKALMKIGITKFRDVKPGEVILIRNGEVVSRVFNKESRRAHCHFEYVYFSDTCSINDGILVDDVRSKLGQVLGREDKLKDRFSERDWLVIPIPSTSVPSAISYSTETKLPIKFSLIKADVGRGFINSSSTRKTIMDSKYNIVPRSVAGKKVILLDDSLIRGETSKRIVKLIREAGASEVHLRIAELPIKFPCCYGVDFPSFEELIVGNFKGSLEELEEFVARKIGVDSISYVSLDGLKESLGGNGEKFCFACLNGEYPTEAGREFLRRKEEKLR